MPEPTVPPVLKHGALPVLPSAGRVKLGKPSAVQWDGTKGDEERFVCVSGFRGACISVLKGFWGADSPIESTCLSLFQKGEPHAFGAGSCTALDMFWHLTLPSWLGNPAKSLHTGCFNAIFLSSYCPYSNTKLSSLTRVFCIYQQFFYN